MDTASGSSAVIRGFELSLKVEGLRPHTIHYYVRSVNGLDRFLAGRPLASARSADIRAYLADVQGTKAPKTVHEVQCGLRRFYRFLVRDGEIGTDPTAELKLIRYRVNPQPTYCEADVRRMLAACDVRTREGVRDAALVTVLFDTGVREGELVSMSPPDWERQSVQVDGKGGVRTIPLGTTALQSIERYMRRWGINEAPLWQGKKGKLTGSGVIQLVRRLSRDAGVEYKGVHAFRRAAAAQMKRLGMNDSDILEVMGWRDVTMLRRYTAAVAGELAQVAHRKFSPGDALAGR